MKRVTVEITFSDNYYPADRYRKIRTAMLNAGVLKATELDLEIASVGAKTGHARKVPK